MVWIKAVRWRPGRLLSATQGSEQEIDRHHGANTPIGKEELAKARAEQPFDKQQTKQLNAIIELCDEQLKKCYRPGGEVWVFVDFGFGLEEHMHDRMLASVKQRFASAGWTVSIFDKRPPRPSKPFSPLTFLGIIEDFSGPAPPELYGNERLICLK